MSNVQYYNNYIYNYRTYKIFILIYIHIIQNSLSFLLPNIIMFFDNEV